MRPFSSLHHHLGRNTFNPEHGSSTFIQKLASNFNTWCQNSEHYNLNNPHRQWGFRSSDIWCCVGGWVVPGTFMALYSFKMTGTTCPSMQCHTQADMIALKQCVTTSNLISMQIVWQYWPLMTELWVQFWVTSYITFTVDKLALENTSLQVLSIISHQLPSYHCSPQLLRSATHLSRQHIKLRSSFFPASIWLITW